MLSWLVGALLACWLLVTVLRNIPALGPPIARRDAARMIPSWALFAKPQTVDMVLLRRDLLRDGTLTCWREVEVAGPRRWYNFIWNPGLSARRAFLYLANEIAAAVVRERRAARQSAPEQGTPAALGQGTATALTAMTTTAYLSILKYLSERSHEAVAATQFMIMAVEDQAITGRYAAAGPRRIMFVSELHRVRRAWSVGAGQ